jgi:hypothetical protein
MNKPTVLLSIAAIALSSTVAFAGYKFTTPVSVNLTSRTANGYMGAARNSTNNVELVGCSARAYADSVTVMCWATDSKGVSATCVKSNAPPSFLSALSHITSESQLSFFWTGDSPICSEIRVATSSSFESKTPPPAQTTTAGGLF